MAAQSLVLCRDPDVLRTLCPLLFEMDMGVEICLGTSGATRMLRKRKFDAIIVECDKDGGGLDVLQQLHDDEINQGAITVGIVDDQGVMKQALATGANFVLSKPISLEDASRILKFTKGMLTRMVRRFLRVAVHHLSHVDIVGMKDPAFILDLSEGGLAMQSLAPMENGQVVTLSFMLPGTQTKIDSTATVVWANETGHIGLEFTEISETHRAQVKSWVVERLRTSPQDVPGGSMDTPAQVRVLSQWMRPLARVIDGTFVLTAAGIFCLVAFLFLRGQIVFPVGFTFALALAVGTILYFSLFLLLDVRFPGTLAVQNLLAAASNRQTD